MVNGDIFFHHKHVGRDGPQHNLTDMLGLSSLLLQPYFQLLPTVFPIDFSSWGYEFPVLFSQPTYSFEFHSTDFVMPGYLKIPKMGPLELG